MTTPSMLSSDAMTAASSAAPRATHAPYAGPVAGSALPASSRMVSGSSGRTAAHAVEPYVPPNWRSRLAPESQPDIATSESPPYESVIAPPLRSDAVERRGEALPWINVFLDERDRAPASATLGEPPRAAAEREDDWPFEEAGTATTELSGELSAHESPLSAPVEGAAPAPLPMWSDDDLLDIMPVRPSDSPSTDPSAHWAALARTETPKTDDDHAIPVSHTESAARALEMLARRVRGGELPLPGYVPELGDAAALAAALAALLGIRR